MTTKRSAINCSFGGNSGDFPFIDHAKNSAWGETTSASWVTTPWHQCIDAQGHVDSTTGRNKPWARLFFIPTPTQYSGNWIISWEGNGEFEIILNTGSNNVVSHTGADWVQVNGQRWKGTDCSMIMNFPGNTDGRMFVRVQNTDGNSTGAYFKNFKFYRADQASLLAAGKIWNPVFKNKLIELNPAVFRMMDAQATNGNPSCRWEYRFPANYNGWTSGGGSGPAYFVDAAYPDATGTNIYTVAAIGTTPASLTHGELAHVRFPNAIVRGGSKTVTAVTKAATAVVSSTAHGYSNGDIVQFYNVVGMTELLDNEYTVANQTANTFELSGINSTTYGVFTSGQCAIVCKVALGGRASKQIKMRDGYQNTGIYSTITANTVFTLMYDQPTDSWLIHDSSGGYSPGLPPEIMMQLFVEMAAEGTGDPISPWFCIPHMAMRSSDANYLTTSDYTKNLITLLKNGDGTYGPLPAACDIWLEHSNETWNSGGAFWQTSYLARVGFLRWGGGRSDFHDYATLKSILCLSDAVSQYGASSRVKRVMGSQSVSGASTIRWAGSATLTSDVLNTWGNAPGLNYDYLAIAPYIEPSSPTALEAAATAWGGGADPSQIDVANAIFTSNSALGTGYYLNTALPYFKTPANTYGFGIVQYEGSWGPFYNSYSATARTFFDAIKADPKWANTVLLPFWNSWVADSKCSLPCWFDFSGDQTWSVWYPDLYSTQLPAWDMMVLFNNPASTTTTESSGGFPSYGHPKRRHRSPEELKRERIAFGILPPEEQEKATKAVDLAVKSTATLASAKPETQAATEAMQAQHRAEQLFIQTYLSVYPQLEAARIREEMRIQMQERAFILFLASF